MKGLCSEFGGPNDKTMEKDDGISFYEAHEADKRADIFEPAASFVPTWKRLRPDFPYIAMRFDHSISREVRREIPYKITNTANGKWAIGFPVDRGPGVETRLIDLSPGLMKRLGLKTDDEVEVEQLI